MSERDTKFRGFARALLDKIEKVSADYNPPPGRYIAGSREWERVVEKIIARYTYDLVRHTCRVLWRDNDQDYTVEEMLSRVPDPSELPE